ncbi:low temperature requirement protein B [Oceanobacillus sp. E9]|uniref:putative polysaccharide biosynthesis protein n=1 Tax=Oceanobacillus TaxID=182709 RepID=UPI00084E6A24|nr:MULTISPECIES: polysaccharide biosynthesis protein [Oceanobacillus]OEH56592.1 low temperature requirement protein B [Oceanobacillus sp. E9]
MKENDTNRLVKGALWLSIAGLLSKILSAGYRIPLQNLTGDMGFYIYQQIYPLLGIATMLALYGFPSAISAVTSRELSQEKRLTWNSFYAPILAILCIFHFLLAAVIWISAPLLAETINEASLIWSYRLTAIVFLFIPVVALFRGVLQGMYQMIPTAVSQIGEQLVRVGIIISAACLVAFSSYSIDWIGMAAVYATFFGICMATIILLVFYVKERNQLQSFPKNSDNSFSIKPFISTVLILGIVAAMNHMTLLFIQLADAITFVPQLLEFGWGNIEAKELKGVFDRGQPLIQLVTVLGSSIALTILPMISEKKLKTEKLHVYTYVRTAFLTGFYIVIGAVIGLLLLLPEINRLLFQNEQGSIELRVLMLSVVFATLAIIGSTVLQGFGYIKRTALFIAITFFIKWIGNQLLIPNLGMMGAAIATVCSLLCLFLLIMMEIRRKLPELHISRSIQWKSIFVAAGILTFYVCIWKLFIPEIWLGSRLFLLIYLMAVCFSGGIIYFIFILRMQGFTKHQLQLLPKSTLLLRLAEKRNKL